MDTIEDLRVPPELQWFENKKKSIKDFKKIIKECELYLENGKRTGTLRRWLDSEIKKESVSRTLEGANRFLKELIGKQAEYLDWKNKLKISKRNRRKAYTTSFLPKRVAKSSDSDKWKQSSKQTKEITRNYGELN